MKQLMVSGLFVLLAFSLSAQVPWVGLYTNAIDLDATSAKNTQIIPLKLNQDIDIKDVSLKYGRPVYIRLDKKYDKIYMDAVHITLIKNSDSVPALQIVTDLNLLAKAGVYEGLLVFLHTSSGTYKPEEVSFSLNRPAAKLEAPQTIRLNVIGDEVSLADPLVLKEAGKLSGISRLQLQSPYFTGVDKNIFVFSKAPVIKAGQTTNAEYDKPEKTNLMQLPLGETKGKIEIDAPELAAPLLVDVVVVRRRGGGWILGTIILGILCSLFFRHYTKDRKELEEKRIEGNDLMEKIEREISAIEDEKFVAEVKELWKPLEAVLKEKAGPFNYKKGRLAELDTLIHDLTTRYAEKKKAFEDLIKGLADKINVLSLIFENKYLAPGIRVGLADAEQHYKKAKEGLEKKDFNGSDQDVTLAITVIDEFINRYTTSVSDAISLFENDKIFLNVLDPVLQRGLKKTAIQIRDRLAAVKESPGDVNALLAAIKAANSIQLNYNEIIVKLKANTEFEFKKQYTGNSNQMNEFQDAFNAWHANLQAVEADPRTKIDEVTLEKLTDVWGRVIAEQQHAGPESAMVSFTLPWLQADEFTQGINFMPAVIGVDTIAYRGRVARRNRFWLSFIQTLFVTLLAVVVVYNLHAPKFIGLWDELIGLFLFSFGLELSFDNVVALREKKS